MIRRYGRFFVFLAVSSALTFFIGVQIADIDLGADRYRLSATFEDATNLRNGDPVRLSGVPVGRVTSIDVVLGEAVVGFTVDDSVELPTDSTVAVQAQNLLNIRELVLRPGTSSTMLESGDVVPNATSAVELGELINELGPLLEAVDPGQVNTLVEALNTAITGNRGAINGLTNDLVVVLDNLASRSQVISQLIDDYGVITGEVARRDGQIQQLIDNLVLLSQTFNASEDALTRALEELPDFSSRLSALLDANAGRLDSIIGDLAVLGSTVHDNIPLLDGLLATAPRALLEVESITNTGDYVTVNFLCSATAPPPCPTPLGQNSPTAADIIDRMLRP